MLFDPLKRLKSRRHPRRRKWLIAPAARNVSFCIDLKGKATRDFPSFFPLLLCWSTQGPYNIIVRTSCVYPLPMSIDTGDPFETLEEPPEQNAFRVAFNHWLPYAWKTSATLGTLAITVVSTATVPGILEGRDKIWKPSLVLVGTLLLASAVAAVISFRDMVWDDHSVPRKDDSEGGAGERRFRFFARTQQYKSLAGRRRDVWSSDSISNESSSE